MSGRQKAWAGNLYFSSDGTKWVGEFKKEKIWNAKMYDKESNVIKEIVKGKTKQ